MCKTWYFGTLSREGRGGQSENVQLKGNAKFALKTYLKIGWKCMKKFPTQPCPLIKLMQIDLNAQSVNGELWSFYLFARKSWCDNFLRVSIMWHEMNIKGIQVLLNVRWNLSVYLAYFLDIFILCPFFRGFRVFFEWFQVLHLF